jgi:hypothetical protein
MARWPWFWAAATETMAARPPGRARTTSLEGRLTRDPIAVPVRSIVRASSAMAHRRGNRRPGDRRRDGLVGAGAAHLGRPMFKSDNGFRAER